MELKDFIKSYNPVFNNEEKCKNFIEWIDTLEFQNSGIVDEQGNIKEDLNVRNVKSYSLNRFKYGTETHYFNLLSKIFLEIFRQYIKEVYGGSFSLKLFPQKKIRLLYGLVIINFLMQLLQLQEEKDMEWFVGQYD